jgi:hypothetical protein
MRIYGHKLHSGKELFGKEDRVSRVGAANSKDHGRSGHTSVLHNGHIPYVYALRLHAKSALSSGILFRLMRGRYFDGNMLAYISAERVHKRRVAVCGGVSAGGLLGDTYILAP